jgi:UrcA family protein
MSISRRSSRAAALVAILAMGATTPALAQTDFVVTHDAKAGTITRSMEVDISDLSLTSTRGRAKLNRRIDFAARTVCDRQEIFGERQLRDYERCYNKAVSNAKDQVRLTQTASR